MPIIEGFIIRRGTDQYFILNSDGSIDWSKNLEDATIYDTQAEAQSVKMRKETGEDTWVYSIPHYVSKYAIPTSTPTQSRKKKPSKRKPVRIVKRKSKRK